MAGSVAGGQGFGFFEGQRSQSDGQAARAGLRDQDLGARLVDVSLAHGGSAGKLRIEFAGSLCVEGDHGGTAAAKVIETVGAAHDDYLRVVDLALQPGSVLDQARVPSIFTRS